MDLLLRLLPLDIVTTPIYLLKDSEMPKIGASNDRLFLADGNL
ncbi:MAG: hypothetical protein ACYDDO_03230 [Acidiferrobacterales bacterium]